MISILITNYVNYCNKISSFVLKTVLRIPVLCNILTITILADEIFCGPFANKFSRTTIISTGSRWKEDTARGGRWFAVRTLIDRSLFQRGWPRMRPSAFFHESTTSIEHSSREKDRTVQWIIHVSIFERFVLPLRSFCSIRVFEDSVSFCLSNEDVILLRQRIPGRLIQIYRDSIFSYK